RHDCELRHCLTFDNSSFIRLIFRAPLRRKCVGALNHERRAARECYVACEHNQKSEMKFTTISIALAGAAIFVLASLMRSQSAAAEPTAESKQSEIDSANRLFQAESLPKLANSTRKSSFKTRRTIQQFSSW